MAEEKEFKLDLLPDELQFICKMCQIAAGKRLADKLECSSVKIEGQYCRHIERIRNVLHGLERQVDIYKKYAEAFMMERFGERTVFQKNEIVKWYRDKIIEGERSIDEFIDMLHSMGVDIVGT